MSLPPDPSGPPRLPRPHYEPPGRPGGVVAAAVILFVTGGLAVLGCCGLNVFANEMPADVEAPLRLVGLVFLASGGLNALLGYYLLHGRQWARITTIVLCAVAMAGSFVVVLVAAASEGEDDVVSSCLGVIVNGVVIALLSGARASEYFRSVRHR